MELAIPLAVLTGFTIGWLTTRNRPMNAEERIRAKFRDLVDDMCGSYVNGQLTRTLELLEPRPYRDDRWIQFRLMAVIVPNHFERDCEPDLLVYKT